MGRRKGSVNKPKDNGQDRSVTNHDNFASEPLTDDQLEALTNSHVEAYSKALQKKKTADAELQLVVKKAKADKIPLVEIKAYIDARSEEGQEKLREQAERIARMARWFKFATQADLFEADTSPPATNRSYRLGKEAGMAGEKPAVPTDCDHDTWMSGWQAGQEALAGGIKKAAEPTSDSSFH